MRCRRLEPAAVCVCITTLAPSVSWVLHAGYIVTVSCIRRICASVRCFRSSADCSLLRALSHRRLVHIPKRLCRGMPPLCDIAAQMPVERISLFQAVHVVSVCTDIHIARSVSGHAGKCSDWNTAVQRVQQYAVCERKTPYVRCVSSPFKMAHPPSSARQCALTTGRVALLFKVLSEARHLQLHPPRRQPRDRSS